MEIDFNKLTELDLMGLYSGLLDTLKSKQVIRTYNSPVGDYAEWLVAQKMNLKLETNSQKGYDAKSEDGIRYQVKSRWEKNGKPQRQLNVIRNLEQNDFDMLIAVIFDDDFSVKLACSVPKEVIKDYAHFSSHQNGYLLSISGKLLSDGRVSDIRHTLEEKISF